MTDEPGFAALETTILEVIRECWAKTVPSEMARAVCEALREKYGSLYHLGPCDDEPEMQPMPLSPLDLAGRGETHTTHLNNPDNQPEFCDRCDDVHRPGQHIL